MRRIEIKHNSSYLSHCEWPLLKSSTNSEVIELTNTPYKWELGLDAVAFESGDIRVCVRPHENGHDLLIEGSHDSRKDEYGTVSRRIHRVLHLPEDVDTNTISANLFPNGMLDIKADKKLVI
uniref:SHSP domain-containing protein n=1 Tax=Acrobeloides nanus TaxID=290746 RepID=A0A914CSW2_9BILA